jgi:hypothetical protein
MKSVQKIQPDALTCYQEWLDDVKQCIIFGFDWRN